MKECCVCFDEVELNSLQLLIPCCHRCVCAGCAATLLAHPPARRVCPICDAFIIGASSVFDL